jgi:hypothetical protein
MKALLLIYVFITSLYWIYLLIKNKESISLLDLVFNFIMSFIIAPILIPLLLLENIKIKLPKQITYDTERKK